MTTTDSRTANGTTMPRGVSPSGPDSLNGHTIGDTQRSPAVEGSASPQVKGYAASKVAPPAGSTSTAGTTVSPTPNFGASRLPASPRARERPAAKNHAPAGSQHSHDHGLFVAHPSGVVAGSFPIGQTAPDLHVVCADGEQQDPPAAILPSVPSGPSLLADPFLALAADVLDDLERVRIANENRLRQLTRTQADSDGEERGFGLDQSHPDVARLAALVDMLAQAEHQATLNLQRQMRRHPLRTWTASQPGIGDKQAARLLAAIGDPYWNTLHERPRLVSELWSYCGYGDARTQVRKRGQRANWDATAKMRAHLVAESCMKQPSGTPWRDLYEQQRTHYDGALHDHECVRCGPSGHPAATGTPLSAGHQHARALRKIAKEILRQLWQQAHLIHEERDGS